MKKALLIIILFALSFSLFSQETSVTDDDSRFFIYSSYKGLVKDTVRYNYIRNVHLYEVSVYFIEKEKYLYNFEIKTEKKIEPEIQIDPTGLYISVFSEEQFALINIKTGEKVIDITDRSVSACCFYESKPFILLEQLDRINIYSKSNGKLLASYKKTYSKQKSSYQLIGKDMYILTNNGSSLKIFNSLNGKRVKNIRAKDFVVDYENNTLIAYTQIQQNLQITKYEIGTWKKLLKVNSRDVVGDIINNSKNKSKAVGVITDYLSYSSFSPDGKYLAMPVIDQDNKEKLYIYSTESLTGIALLEVDVKSKILKGFQWYSESNIVIINQRHSFYSDDFSEFEPIEFYFSEEENGVEIPWRKVKKNYFFSPSYKLIVSNQNSIKSYQTYIKSCIEIGSASYAEELNAISFDKQEKYLFVKNKQDELGYLDLAEYYSNKMSLNAMNVIFFSTIPENSLEFDVPEAVIQMDMSKPETSKDLNLITDVLHISELPEGMPLKVTLKSIDSYDSQTEIQLHLVDTNGVYYYGASEQQFQYIWDQIIIGKNEDSEYYEVYDFEVDEHIRDFENQNAFSIVVDQSGSIGNNRSQYMKQVMKAYFASDTNNNAYNLMYFDTKVKEILPFGEDSKDLSQSIKLNNLGDFGGGTSIFDAVERSLSSLDYYEGNPYQKGIILFTDGSDNSSLLKLNQIIKHANYSNIPVYIVAFNGEEYNSYAMKVLSSNTNGFYYSFNSDNTFNYIFDDIANKTNYYYTVKYKTAFRGEQDCILSVINGDIVSDLKITYTNDNISTNKDSELQLKYKSEVEFIMPSEVIKSGQEIVDNAGTSDLNGQEESNINDKEPTKIEKEFGKINFPDIHFYFDKIVIVEGTDEDLDEVAKFLIKNKDQRIEIQGHTDSRGSIEYNINLSRMRAVVVRDLLIEMGVDPEQIQIRALGELKPRTNNNTDINRLENRRIEFVLL